MTFAYFVISFLMNAVNSRGVFPTGSAPCFNSAACMSLERVAFMASALSLESTGWGSFAGPTMPYHASDS